VSYRVYLQRQKVSPKKRKKSEIKREKTWRKKPKKSEINDGTFEEKVNIYYSLK
jgi:hypothetical protein